MNIEKKRLLVFGYGLTIILSIIAVRIWIALKSVTAVSILCGFAFLILAVTVINCKALKSFYRIWMKGAHFIGTVITGIILSVLFYAIFGIIGIIMRLFRKDFLHKKLDADSSTYWIKKEETFDKNNYVRQF